MGSVILVVVAFSGYVFVHELGHFLAAKRVGVRVEVFSLGFGPFILTYRRGETLYALSLIPLGGYVKMAGQSDTGPDTYTGKPYEYTAKTPFQRMEIAIAGVIMNFLGGYIVFVAAYMVGVEVIPPVVASVDAGSPAEIAGLMPGDRIVKIDGSPVRSFGDIEQHFIGKGIKPVEIDAVDRDGKQRTVSMVLPGPTDRPSLGINPEIPVFAGIEGQEAAVYVVDVAKDSPADEADIKPGDIIVAIDGAPITYRDQLREKTSTSEGQMIALDVRRDGAPLELVVTPRVLEKGKPSMMGVMQASVLEITRIHENSAAEAGGLTAGDRIVVEKIIGHERDGDEDSPKYSLVVNREREGKFETVSLPVNMDEQRGAALAEVAPRETLRLGIMDSMVMGYHKTVDFTMLVIRFIKGLVTRLFKMKELAGVITVISVTYEATKQGLGALLMLSGFISINLAVFNLFPLPPLDGGLLVFLGYEKIRGKPLPRRIQEGFLFVGIVLLLGLFVVATRNDILRLITGGG